MHVDGADGGDGVARRVVDHEVGADDGGRVDGQRARDVVDADAPHSAAAAAGVDAARRAAPPDRPLPAGAGRPGAAPAAAVAAGRGAAAGAADERHDADVAVDDAERAAVGAHDVAAASADVAVT